MAAEHKEHVCGLREQIRIDQINQLLFFSFFVTSTNQTNNVINGAKYFKVLENEFY